MKFKLKDPGSSITHFIGMLMALFAATPLLIRASTTPDKVHVISLSIFILSMILLYGASATYHALDLSEKSNRILRKLDHMMIFVLIAGTYTPVCLIVLGGSVGYSLSEMVFFYIIHCHGLGMCPCLYPHHQFPFSSGIRLAFGWGNYLYNWRRYLCPKAAYFQFQTQKFWIT